MKKLMSIIAGVVVLGAGSIAQGEDCPGTPWRKGPTCVESGLNSQRGTCLPGDMYETLCDDANYMIKTCPGPNRCQQENQHKRRHDRGNDYYDDQRREPCDWDYIYNRPCPQGYINLDCSGACEPVRRW